MKTARRTISMFVHSKEDTEKLTKNNGEEWSTWHLCKSLGVRDETSNEGTELRAAGGINAQIADNTEN